MIVGCASTLCRVGVTRAAKPTTWAWSSRSRGTTITLRFTGRDSTNVWCDTTVTASGAPRLRYLMLVTFTFVTLMLVTLVTLVTFTLRTYVLLT